MWNKLKAGADKLLGESYVCFYHSQLVAFNSRISCVSGNENIVESQRQSICVLGGGAMGTACAVVLAGNGHDVRLWLRSPEYAEQIAVSRENVRLLPGIFLPPSVLVTSDARAALDTSSMVVVCVPTRGIRDALAEVGRFVPKQALIVSAVKGIENRTLIRPSQMIREVLGDVSVTAFGGPCHAEEVARSKPASVVAACDRIEDAETVQQVFSNGHLRVYANNDLHGVELAAALKNVIAIAAGISDGLELGDNAKSALICRGLTEMVRFGECLNVQRSTFYGLAGVGDLIATCGSRHSRNRLVGELLGKGQTLQQITSSMSAVAEGVFTAESIFHMAQQNGIDMPIATEVYQVLFHGKPPALATQELMQRPLREE
ncbi:MAG: NAD(P)H-dependent glycerol-3-phosphate dehydrogenase [Planctomycetaceae bacterium]